LLLLGFNSSLPQLVWDLKALLLLLYIVCSVGKWPLKCGNISPVLLYFQGMLKDTVVEAA